MARSRDFRKYVIVTKAYDYGVHQYEDGEVPKAVKDLIGDEKNKTFWMFDKDTGELIGRYSVLSAPQWVMEIYKIVVDRNVE